MKNAGLPQSLKARDVKELGVVHKSARGTVLLFSKNVMNDIEFQELEERFKRLDEPSVLNRLDDDEPSDMRRVVKKKHVIQVTNNGKTVTGSGLTHHKHQVYYYI